MRNATFWLFILVQFLQGCKTPEFELSSSSVVPQAKLPKVLAFSLPGIPPENISIDHDKREIQVILPTDISKLSLPASVTVSAGFTSIAPGSSTPYLFDLSAPRQPVSFYKQDNQAAIIEYVPYTVTAKASGPLEITSVPSSLSFETGQPMMISVKNYYDDAVMENSVIITNQLTGQQYGYVLESCYEGMPVCKGGIVGAVMAYFDSYVPSGKYNLEIRKANKRQARASGSLTVSKGLPSVYDDSYNPSSPGTRNRKLGGVNLLESDQIELLLKNQTGDQYTLKPSGFAADGKSLVVDIPAAIKPSQYSVQPIRNGQLIPTFSRMVISRDRSQPAFVSFYFDANYQNPDVPIVIERGQRQGFTFVISENIADVRLKLIPVETGQPVILVDVDMPVAYLMAGPDGGLPFFSIPQTTPTGTYKLVLQHIMTDKRVVEGEPLERLLEVR